MQQQTRRRQSTNHFSPAASTTRKLHHPSPHRQPPNCRRPAAAAQSEEYAEEDQTSINDYSSAVGKKRSNPPMTSASVGRAGAELRRVSSFGSCSTCPATPSPVCSPLSSSSPRSAEDGTSFATPDQSSCVISDAAEKEEASRGKTRQESRTVAASHYGSMKRESDGSSRRRCNSRLKETRCVRPTRGRFLYEPDRALAANMYHDSDNDDDRRLPAVSEEQQVDTRGCNCLTMPSHVSSGSDDEGSGGYENSDMESYVEERMASTVHQGRLRGCGANFAAETGRNKLEEKLTAWKEARMMKLMDKLRRDEAAIDKWEMKKTAEAKNDAKRAEAKLDKKWSRELKKMQRRIHDAQKEAEKRKIRERAATAEKIAKVTEAFERTAVTGKLPWWFRCL